MDFQTLAKQNPWWADKGAINQDPKIRDLEAALIKWHPRLLKYIDLNIDAFYSVRGPRQVGKTTLAKMLIREELKIRKPQDVFYFACDLITNSVGLVDVLETYLAWAERQSDGRKLIILDEVSRVKDWEYGYKQVVDIHSLKNKTIIFTGSSCWDLKHGVERLGGRKGEETAGQNHKIFLPMKFSEYAQLMSPVLKQRLDEIGLSDSSARKGAFGDLFSSDAHKWLDPLLPLQAEADALLDEYLLTGGVMSAVNQYHSKHAIGNSTYELYLQLFFGDLARLSRSELTSKKALSAILGHQGKPVGWTRMASETGIPSSLTVSEYADVLQTLFVLNIYNAFNQHAQRPKQRSEKKLQIWNPFFFHAFRAYLENPSADYFKSSKEWLSSSENRALLVEQVVGDHLTRLSYNLAPSDLFDQSNAVFYIRNSQGEQIDFIARLPDGMLPVEVKYQNAINSGDSRQIKKHPRGILATKNHLSLGTSHPCIPVSLLLLFI